MSYHKQILYKNLVNRKHFFYNVLDEVFLTNQIVFYFTKNFYLIDEINKKISQFKANGLIIFWMAKYIENDKNRSKEPPSRLNIKHLNGTFELLVCGLIIASMVFVVELLKKKFCEMIRKCKTFLKSNTRN